ncbi:hypothetical protein GQ607_007496 [Colletotrichum asianum]|uniref:Uncharacterized protein n=1 Tax=Colletotrichum asianum TaxID=702518 RepID=A0A8H3WE22_9PEZI|nr:hypothetical protein GQ607_007496 [Colletotrichum asianum]
MCLFRLCSLLCVVFPPQFSRFLRAQGTELCDWHWIRATTATCTMPRLTPSHVSG